MTTDLEKHQAYVDQATAMVPNLETGEILDLHTADSADIAHALFAIRQKEAELKAMKAMVGEELNKRLDANASWTEHMGAFQVKGQSPQPTREADLEPLATELALLLAEGRITPEAVTNALERVVTQKIRWSGIDAIRKISPEVKERIDKHIREVEKKRYAPSVQMMRPE